MILSSVPVVESVGFQPRHQIVFGPLVYDSSVMVTFHQHPVSHVVVLSGGFAGNRHIGLPVLPGYSCRETEGR